jgi:hypothetical protein
MADVLDMSVPDPLSKLFLMVIADAADADTSIAWVRVRWVERGCSQPWSVLQQAIDRLVTAGQLECLDPITQGDENVQNDYEGGLVTHGFRILPR